VRQIFKVPPRGLILTFVAVAAAIGVVAFTPTASADKPLKSEGGFSGEYTLTDACSFPIDVTFNVTYTEQDYPDKSGALRVHYHITEQDTFTTTANSLPGVPFTFNVHFVYDSEGVLTRQYAQGVQEKVPLPDGGHFISAGRINWLAHPNVPFVLLPDNGATVNLDRFCAALAP
jgi:hypothetical protein